HMFPARWHNYLQCGQVIKDSNLICFKTPLRPELFAYVTSEEDVWTAEQIVKQNPSIGAIIDLTNTSKYYDGVHFLRAGLLYKKIQVPGQTLPPESIVQEFIDTVKEFTEKCPGMLVGVHCTHGINRTGYMVCRYLMHTLGIAPQEAIDRFEKARGHKIERQNYVQDLLI
nr:Chain A, polynucleotide 5'-phosphatase [Autographa californica nucleopolyhedrovirus]1YN9_B Chain B, polynucleotide 5'-phosphatase [Autographa californica nucleopolyhedrovirus]1YN9_C Chain C, polynucleotide 5'-phosphatase [Autographa californica nucleopolyhedrovirus]